MQAYICAPKLRAKTLQVAILTNSNVQGYTILVADFVKHVATYVFIINFISKSFTF